MTQHPKQHRSAYHPDGDFEDRLVGGFQKQLRLDARRARRREQRPYRRATRLVVAFAILGLLGLRAIGINPIATAFDLIPDQASSRIVAAANDLFEPTPTYESSTLIPTDYAPGLAAFHTGFNMLAETLLWTLLGVVTLLLVIDLLRRRARARREAEPDPLGLAP